MIPQWVIEKKRDGEKIPEKELRDFVEAYARGDLPDYQMSAFAMAVLLKGMDFEEITVLTDVMMRSGDILDLSMLSRPTVDKHSTGGIGDKISIPLAPLVASAGAAVPMISGRGLGITGGTLDKLESIPGYNTQINPERFIKILDEVGCSIIGQTAKLAPADKKLYALRDVTGTVPSIDLISASIMSKKLAEGASGLVLDVKCGLGAFMKTHEDASKLAKTMIQIGCNMGRNMAAIITPMDQPLGRTVGNSLEIEESIEVLKGNGPEDVVALTLTLGAKMLMLCNISKTECEARELLIEKLKSGSALEVFRRMVEAHGGNSKVIDDYSLMQHAPVVVDIVSEDNGYVASVNADSIGRVVLMLGGGRQKTDNLIDYGVGVDRLVKCGAKVAKGDILMRVHAKDRDSVDKVMPLVNNAVTINE